MRLSTPGDGQWRPVAAGRGVAALVGPLGASGQGIGGYDVRRCRVLRLLKRRQRNLHSGRDDHRRREVPAGFPPAAEERGRSGEGGRGDQRTSRMQFTLVEIGTGE